jgi:hypothetical protein
MLCGQSDAMPLAVQWDATENKSTVFLYGGGVIVGLWATSSLVGAINGIPLVRASSSHHVCSHWYSLKMTTLTSISLPAYLDPSAAGSGAQVPKLMELIGLGYSSWFVYRYLLFKDNRKDLVADVEELKSKIGGDKM